ncbi:MAG: hypothetical protein AAF589_07165 [Planctomycetota bacterium]
MAPPAAAQTTAESDEVDRRLSRRGSIVKRWVARPTGAPEDIKLFKDFFDTYYFPAMTQSGAIEMGDIATLRYNFFRQFMTPATPEIQKQLTDKAFVFASRVIRRKAADGKPRRYSREVEYNAVLLLGDLGSSYPRTGAKPKPEANTFLCQISGLASTKRLPAYMQAGALVGLAKHAAFLDELPQTNQEKTTTALLTATGPDAVADGGDMLTKDWLRGRAASGLAAIAKKTGDAKLIAKLVELAGDDSLTLDTRAEIAASLDGLSLPPDGSAAQTVLALAGEIGEAEAKEAADFEEKQIGSRGSRDAAQLIKSDRFRYDTTSSRWVYVREGLAARLNALRAGLQATRASAGDRAQRIQTAATAVNATLSQAINEDTIDLDVSAEIKRMGDVLKSVAKDPGEADAEAATDEVEEEAAGLF